MDCVPVNTYESRLGNESRGEDRNEATGPRNIHIRNGDRSEDKTGNLWAAASSQGLAGRMKESVQERIAHVMRLAIREG